ncbi:MAG: hypothetical protein KKG47_06305 [Proteobacteria bacterium]|nr:hypothetical protein [Pseudomonadota bacterium]MBU1738445.1 hypothetical protein [Pseudomonadota bacterium]
MSEEMGNIDTAIAAAKKSVVSREKELGEEAVLPSGPVGLDIGTSHIVMAQNNGKHINTVKQLNAFFTIPYAKFTKKILLDNDVSFFEKDKQFYILGYSADNFANMFNTNTRRTMEKGLLSAKEPEGVTVMKSIISTLIKKSKGNGETICFSMPGEPVGGTNSVVYHESIIKMFLTEKGYKPISINEGLATVMSELANDNFTGIGISMGGGMCNICLAYLSVPVITYSIQKGGDYIDNMVGLSLGEPATKVKVIKEASLNLSKPPTNRVETALHIYYQDLIDSLLQSLEDVLQSSDKIPKIAQPIPIALSGGTVMPEGFQEMFSKSLKNYNLPVEISQVRIARNPLNTTAKGAMVMALSEEI